MAITHVGSNSAFTTAGTMPLSVSVPSGVLNGDILVAVFMWGGADQVVTMPAGWNVLVDRLVLSSSTGTFVVVYRTMATGVTGVSFTLPAANTGKAVLGITAYRGAAIDVLGTAAQRSTSSTNTVAPSVTTTTANDWIVGFFGERVSSQTAVTAPTGMTSRVSYFTGGGAGVSAMIADVPQPSAGASGTKTAIYGVGSAVGAGVLLALKPISNIAPSVNAGSDQTVAAGTLVTLSATSTDSDGTVVTRAWTQTSGPTVTLSAPSAASTTFTPASGGTYTFVHTATDNGGETGTDTVVVYVPQVNSVPISVVSNPGGYVNVGGASSIPAALADSSDITFAESPDMPSGAALTLAFNPLSPGLVTVTTRARCTGTVSTMTMVTGLYDGGALIASWTDVVTTTNTNYVHITTELEAADITDYNNLRVRHTATES